MHLEIFSRKLRDPTAVVLYSTLYEKKSFFVAAWVKTIDKEKKGSLFF
jgi:hypothetical protein